MLMDWLNQHRKSGYITKSNLHVQSNTHQNSNDIHQRDWKIYTIIHLDTQKTANSQGNTEQKLQCWRCHNTQVQIILQSHSIKNSMLLAQKQIWRTREQNWGPRYESIQLRPPYFWQSHQKHTMEIRQPLQQMLLGKVAVCLQKTETRSMPSPCTSIHSKWIKDVNIRPKTLKLVHERAGNTLETIGIGKDFLNRTPSAQHPRERTD
jgi:hypothetical protein